MKNTKNFRIIASLAAVVIFVGMGWYFLDHRTAQAPVSPSNEDTNASSTTYTLPDGSVLSLPPGAIVREENIAAPNYKRPLVYKIEVSEEVKAVMETKFQTALAALAKNNADFGAWVALGGLRKMAGDFAGAAEDWTYVTLLYPTSEVGFNNLGDLYMNFTKEYPKAEANYKQAIALKPGAIDVYLNLFLLYRDLYKQNTSAAEDILKLGIKNNPDNVQLKATLAEYQSGKAQ